MRRFLQALDFWRTEAFSIAFLLGCFFSADCFYIQLLICVRLLFSLGFFFLFSCLFASGFFSRSVALVSFSCLFSCGCFSPDCFGIRFLVFGWAGDENSSCTAQSRQLTNGLYRSGRLVSPKNPENPGRRSKWEASIAQEFGKSWAKKQAGGVYRPRIRKILGEEASRGPYRPRIRKNLGEEASGRRLSPRNP